MTAAASQTASTPLAPPGSLRRSVQLFRAFRLEQSRPEVFYGLLARDSVREVGRFLDLDGATVVDVGGGPGYFARAFESAGARYAALDADAGELGAVGEPGANTVQGSGMLLPLATDAVDLSYSSNVLEHVRDPYAMAAEMVRVTRPGGIVFLSWTTWFSPWGGHETAPWHYLGGRYAADRFARSRGRRPKNDFGRSLFATHAGRLVRWARTTSDAEVVAVFPRYHPRWAHWVAKVPILREVAVWNLVIVLRVH
ncbi:class I SAM-dependent methyltransferase [Pedococcus sp. 5OH_020]|uniref:class I SAM-dependent methyltransferase n=1 Tax=Pedococcus sp. 5OH_020 TaxID=2989814 RepID=UPI0022E9B247|nr:class I SAM-dependent methyltransferase [Pedococcus sp. 5OH_020]